MAEDSIGNLIPTKIPTLGTDADIQTALRMYHYGTEAYALNSTANTNPATLPAQGIAKYIYDLQTTVATLVAASGIPTSTFNAKGDLLVGKQNDQVEVLSRGSDTFVLTVDLTADNYLAWKEVAVRPDNSVTFTNKTLSSPKFTGSILDTNGNELITFPSAVLSAVNELTISNSTTGNGVSISTTGGDTNIDLLLVAKGSGVVKADGIEVATISGSQTLTNKTIDSITTNANTLNFPAITATDTLVSLNFAQTVSNKTFVDEDTYFVDKTDSIGLTRFLVGSNSATVSLTLPSTSGTLALNDQTFFLGTTSVAINRASASQTLNGVSIDGNAATATNATTATKSTNIIGGATNRIAYQTAADTTGFINAPSVSGTYLQWTTGSGFVWSAVSAGVTSVTGTAPIVSSGGTTPAISINNASTTQRGSVQLNNTVTSTSITEAATANAVKTAYDLANTASTRIYASAYKSAGQSVGAATLAQITYDTETADNSNAFASSTFTFPSTGKYRITCNANVLGGNTSGSTSYLALFINGTQAASLPTYTRTLAATYQVFTVDTIYSATSGEALTARFYNGATAGSTVVESTFTIDYVGA